MQFLHSTTLPKWQYWLLVFSVNWPDLGNLDDIQADTFFIKFGEKIRDYGYKMTSKTKWFVPLRIQQVGIITTAAHPLVMRCCSVSPQCQWPWETGSLPFLLIQHLSMNQIQRTHLGQKDLYRTCPQNMGPDFCIQLPIYSLNTSWRFQYTNSKGLSGEGLGR